MLSNQNNSCDHVWLDCNKRLRTVTLNSEDRDSEILRVVKTFIYYWEQSREPWWVKNSNSQIVYANASMKSFIGLPEGFDIEGRYDHELPVELHRFASQFRQHDRQVLREKERSTSLQIQRFNRKDYLEAWYTEKYPLFGEKGDIIGVIPHFRPVESIFVSRLANIKTPSSLMFNAPSKIFTEKEWQVIFYTCQFFTPKMIGKAINISHRTVEDILCRIYKKTGVGNKRGLIDYCIEHGFNNFIPPGIFQTCDSIMPL